MFLSKNKTDLESNFQKSLVRINQIFLQPQMKSFLALGARVPPLFPNLAKTVSFSTSLHFTHNSKFTPQQSHSVRPLFKQYFRHPEKVCYNKIKNEEPHRAL
jgi:hypothetical protein